MSDSAEFKSATKNMLKELKETTLKELKESTVTCHQIENIMKTQELYKIIK